MHVLLLLPWFTSTFTPATAQRGGGAPALEVYVNPKLGAALQYPAVFTRERPNGSADRFGEFSVFAFHPAADPNQLGVDPCAPLAVAMGTGSGFDRVSDRTRKIKADEYGVQDAKGTITFSELKRSCVDPNALDDSILADIVGKPLKEKGITAINRVQNTLVQNNTVWWASGAGYGKDAKGKRRASEGLVIFGSAAAVVNGHILVWRISANSPSAFNRLLDTSVCFAAPTCETGYSRLINLHLGPTEIASR